MIETDCEWTANVDAVHENPAAYRMWLPNACEWVPTCSRCARIFEQLLRQPGALSEGQRLESRRM